MAQAPGNEAMPVVTTEVQGDVAIIRINRPEKLNAISQAVAVALQAAMRDFDASAQRVAVLSAAGTRAFSAGADVSDLPELWRAIPHIGCRTDKPIIAATSGWCVGAGMVMVTMCDLAVSTEDTVFHYPEGRIGFTGGMISSLANRIPHKIAMEMMLLGRKVDARRAYEVGFINQVVPNGTHEAAALEMAREIAAQAPLVVRSLMRLVDEMQPENPIARMARTSEMMTEVRDSCDLREGIAAFREKRKPRFSGQ